MDWETIGAAFERPPTKLVSIDSTSGLIRSYEATAGGAPKLRQTMDMKDPHPESEQGGSLPT